MEIINAIGGVLTGWIWLTYSSLIGIILIANFIAVTLTRFITHGEHDSGLPYIGKKIDNILEKLYYTDWDCAGIIFGFIVPIIASIFILILTVAVAVAGDTHVTFFTTYKFVTFDVAFAFGYMNAGPILSILAFVGVLFLLRAGYPLYAKIKTVVDK